MNKEKKNLLKLVYKQQNKIDVKRKRGKKVHRYVCLDIFNMSLKLFVKLLPTLNCAYICLFHTKCIYAVKGGHQKLTLDEWTFLFRIALSLASAQKTTLYTISKISCQQQFAFEFV